MSTDNTVEVSFNATTDGVEKGAQQASKAIETSLAAMKTSFASIESSVKQLHEQFAGAFGGMQAAMGKFNNAMFAVQNAIAGGSMFKEFVAASMETTKAAAVMGKTLGITATEASYLKSALTAVGVSQDTLMAAAGKITLTLAKNEEAFKGLGVATRDSNGNFLNTRDIMESTNERLRAFKEGTDRNVEGMKIYGRSWAEVAPLVNKFNGETEETRRTAEALNLVVGQEAVSAMANYKTSQQGVGEVMEGIKNTIGEQLMPRMTELANFFRSIGPQAVEATRIAMAGYLAIQDEVVKTVKILLSTIYDAFTGITKAIRGGIGAGSESMGAMELFQNMIKVVQVAFVVLRVSIQEAVAIIKGVLEGLGNECKMVGGVISAALHGDWAGVKAAWAAFKTDTTATLKNTMDEAVRIAKQGKADIDAAVMGNLGEKKKATAIVQKEGGERSQAEKPDDAKAPKKDKSEMSKWEAENRDAKAHYEMENGLRLRDLAEDVAFWREKAAHANVANGDKTKALAKASEAELALMKKNVSESKAMTAEQVAESERAAMYGVDLQRKASEQELALGKVTAVQMIAIEIGYENQRAAIAATAQRQRIQAVIDDPNSTPAALQQQKNKMLEIERAHELKLTDLKKKAAIEDAKLSTDFFKSVESNMTGLINGVLSGTTKMKDIFSGVFSAIYSAFAGMAAKIAAEWLMTAIKGKVSSVMQAISQINANAAVAGSAAFASTAAIPIIGPALAPAAGAAGYAGALSFVGAVTASARGGYDIPAGVNPVTQLHEREMVLPQKQADAVRNMAESGRGGGDVHLHVSAVDGASVKKLFNDHGSALAAALRRQAGKVA